MALTTVPVELASLDGAVTVNESSADVDFRIESNGDTHRLFIDGGNDRLLIGTTASRAMSGVTPDFFIEGTSYADSGLGAVINANGAIDCPVLLFGKSRGTSLGSNTIVQNGDRLFTLRVDGSDGTNLEQAAMIEVHVDTAPGANEIPGRITFHTTNDGSQYATEKMRIDNAGRVGIGTTPESWSSTWEVLQVGDRASISSQNGNVLQLAENTYNDGSNWKAVGSDAASLIYMDSGTIQMYTAPSVSADANQTFSTVMNIDNNGHVQMPLQSAFQAVSSANQENIAVGSDVTVVFASVRFDQNSDYNNSTYTFTAPVTGKYWLGVTLRIDNMDQAASYYRLQIVTSNRTYYPLIQAGATLGTSDPPYSYMQGFVLADMDASDTALVKISQVGGSAQMDIIQTESQFQGYLVA